MLSSVYVLVNGLEVIREVATNKPQVEGKLNRLVRHLDMLVNDLIDILDEIDKLLMDGKLTDSELEAIYFAFFPEGQDTDIHDVLDYATGLFSAMPDKMGNKLKILLNKMHRLAGLIYSWYHNKHGFTENISLDEI